MFTDSVSLFSPVSMHNFYQAHVKCHDCIIYTAKCHLHAFRPFATYDHIFILQFFFGV